MTKILFKYRTRDLRTSDIDFIKQTIEEHYQKGRSYISRELCKSWDWKQPNGNLKEYAARDLLLRLEEKNFITLPPRKRPKNNLKAKSFDQKPFYIKKNLCGVIKTYEPPTIKLCSNPQEAYLCDYLFATYHYLGAARLVGAHLRHLVFIEDQIVGCLGWTSAAWKLKDRDKFIGWDEPTKRKNLYLLANNTRFLILPWISIKHLASKVLSLTLRRLSKDWQERYDHPIYLAESYVDQNRFKGISYQASNWIYVGQSKGSSKRGNSYNYHGQSKAIYLYPTDRRFRRFLNDDQG